MAIIMWILAITKYRLVERCVYFYINYTRPAHTGPKHSDKFILVVIIVIIIIIIIIKRRSGINPIPPTVIDRD